jgi:carbonic anhydrase/acetyltransferase-like protein (isoleucine patch superfamily)
MKLFGVKTSFSNATIDSWVNSEFVEIGKNVTIGQGAYIGSSMIFGDYLIIKKIILEDNVLIGTHTVVCPGTIMRKNSILSALSFTLVDQELEEGWIYLGIPAKKYRENEFFDDEIEILFETELGDLTKWGKAIEKRQHITDKGEDVEKNY